MYTICIIADNIRWTRMMRMMTIPYTTRVVATAASGDRDGASEMQGVRDGSVDVKNSEVVIHF